MSNLILYDWISNYRRSYSKFKSYYSNLSYGTLARWKLSYDVNKILIRRMLL